MPRKKTHEEYVQEVLIKNPNIEVIGQYTGANIKIFHKCNFDGYEWEATPGSILYGCGCPKCAGNIKKTNKQYKEEVKNINPSIEVIGNYINAKEKILHKCLICNYEWLALSSNILNGHGCPQCAINKTSTENRKTHQQYCLEVSRINPYIKVIGEYKGATTPIKHYCLTHNIYWDVEPTSILQGSGCPQCGKEKISNKLRKPINIYIEELKQINPNVTLEDTYINTITPVLHKCHIHNIFWKVSPNSVLRGQGCKQCGVEKFSISNTKTDADYIDELKINNPTIISLESYIGCATPILHKCLICNYEWRACPKDTLRGHGCLRCAGNIKKTNDQYLKELDMVNSNIVPEENYINAKTPILHRCLIDNYTWKATPSDILHGKGCIYCGRRKSSQSRLCSDLEYQQKIQVINPNIISKEKYINSKTPILHKCLLDGYEWKAKPVNIISGCGCLHCHETKGERKIRIWLESNELTYIFQYKNPECKDIRILPFDFYLPELNVIIEYDGKQHFESVDYFGGIDGLLVTQKHDQIKNEFCDKNGIKLLRIPYYKFDKIEEELNNFLFI